jgi:hypothetical protein
MKTIPLRDMTPADVAEVLRDIDEAIGETRRLCDEKLADLAEARAQWEVAYRRKCVEYGVPGFTTKGD